MRSDQLHNDSTTVSFYGAYDRDTVESSDSNPSPLLITWGHNKDHRPDLKQLLYILTVARDGAVPVHFTAAGGNVTDDTTHRDTWDLLCQLAGRHNVLYVADCKLASADNMNTIHRNGGRFITVPPKTRKEDKEFRKRLDWCPMPFALFVGSDYKVGTGGSKPRSLATTERPMDLYEDEPAPPRRTLVVKPIFTYPLPVRRRQTSWRAWGGIQTEEDAARESIRIEQELDHLKAAADFPLNFLPLAKVRGIEQLNAVQDVACADALLFYSAGDGAGNLMAEVNWVDALGKDTVFFVRHQSGPLYYWYEGASARFLRQHTDFQATKTIRCEDTVVDRMDEVLWRLRALCGLRATVGSRIVVVGWPDLADWPPEETMDSVRRLWKLDIQPVSYEALGKLIRATAGDQKAAALARRRAEAYLKIPETKLETDVGFVHRAFLLEQVFRALMKQADCRAITVAGCMSAVMPIAETTACVPLSTLNDAGYLALCEADFGAIPAAILLGNISGLPTFMNAPTFPHEGIITLGHCTAPRKMDGKTRSPVRILTHFESDYGAAPRVEMPVGQKVTMVVPDFASKRYLGLSGQIEFNPFLAICRTQLDIRLNASSRLVAERMPGYRWVLIYGDHLRETGYALRRAPIEWDCPQNIDPLA